MRLILTSNDARELRAQIAANPRAELKVAIPDPRNVMVEVAGTVFRGRARPTPSRPGSVVIEDPDGVTVAEVVLRAD